MKKLINLILVTLATIVLLQFLTGCNKNASAQDIHIVTVEESKAVLNEMIDYAANGNTEKLLIYGGAEVMMRHDLDLVGGFSSVPNEPPQIIDTYLIPQQSVKNSTSLGDRVLVLQGTNNFGCAYHTDFLVCWDPYSKKLVVSHPIYWTGMGVGTVDENGTGRTILTSPGK